MRSTLFLSILLFLSTIDCFGQDYEYLYSDNSRLMMASSLPSLMQKANCCSTDYYISDNISAVRVVRAGNKTYISWDVCDDNTFSEFFIIKSYDDKKYMPVATVKNIPEQITGVPLLYSTVDEFPLNKLTYYKLIKIEANGTIKHIITVILPYKETPTVNSIPLKKFKNNESNVR